VPAFIDGTTPWPAGGISLRDHLQRLIARALEFHPPAEIEALGRELARRTAGGDADRQVQLHRAVAFALSDAFEVEDDLNPPLGAGQVALLHGILRGGLSEGADASEAERLLERFLRATNLPTDPGVMGVSQDDLDKLGYEAPDRSALLAVSSTLPLAQALQTVLRWERDEGDDMPGHREEVIASLRACAAGGDTALRASVAEALAALDEADEGEDDASKPAHEK